MTSLTNDEIRALCRVVNLEVEEPDLTQVRYSLSAILEAMDRIDIPGLDEQEPLPIIPPREQTNG